MMRSIPIALLSVLVLCLLAASTRVNAWDYCNGGSDWGRTYPACYGGSRQSPVPIDGSQTTEVQTLAPLSILSCAFGAGTKTTVELLNNGVTYQLRFSRPNSTTNPKKVTQFCTIRNPRGHMAVYSLAQIHVHMTAEHVINDVQLPFELHFVFERNLGSETAHMVVAVQGMSGPTSASLTFTESLLQKLIVQSSQKTLNAGQSIVVDGLPEGTADDILPERPEYFAYLGSLTTPPCTEGVDWFVFQQPILVSAPIIRGIQAAMERDQTCPSQRGNWTNYNARTLQALLGRTIDRYGKLLSADSIAGSVGAPSPSSAGPRGGQGKQPTSPPSPSATAGSVTPPPQPQSFMMANIVVGLMCLAAIIMLVEQYALPKSDSRRTGEHGSAEEGTALHAVNPSAARPTSYGSVENH